MDVEQPTGGDQEWRSFQVDGCRTPLEDGPADNTRPEDANSSVAVNLTKLCELRLPRIPVQRLWVKGDYARNKLPRN